MSFLTGVFIIILAGIGAGTITEIAKAIGRRGGSSSKLAALQLQVEQYGAALEDAQSALATQAAQLAELQERVDFAERVLTKARDRLPPGSGREQR